MKGSSWGLTGGKGKDSPVSLGTRGRASRPPKTIRKAGTEAPDRSQAVKNVSINRIPFRMEYDVTEGSGWIRQNKGEVKEFKGQKLPLEGSWNSILAVLPSLLGKESKRSLAGKETIEGKEAVGIKVSGPHAEAVL